MSNPSIQIIHQPPGGGRERIGGRPSLTRRRKPDKQVTKGVVESKVKEIYQVTPWTITPGVWGGRSLPDHLSVRICFPGLFAGHKGTEGHLRLTEKLLCEQRWKLQALPTRDRRIGRQCVLQGERVHSTRRGHVRPGRPGKPDTGGGDLDIWADRKRHGQQ